MYRLTSYQTGLWLAEYVDIRCQLCRVYRSTSQSQLLPSPSLLGTTDASKVNSAANILPSSHSRFANIRQKLDHTLNSGLLCEQCHHSIAWLPKPFKVDVAAGISLPIKTAKEDSTRH